MLARTFLLLLILSPLLGCSNFYIEQGVRVDKYDFVYDLPSIGSLPEGACTRNKINTECNIRQDTEIRWGAGFCTEDTENMERRLAISDPELFINNNPVPKKHQLIDYEYFDREEYPICYAWLVKLSKWEPGSVVKLMSMNKNILLGTVTINVLPETPNNTLKCVPAKKTASTGLPPAAL